MKLVKFSLQKQSVVHVYFAAKSLANMLIWMKMVKVKFVSASLQLHGLYSPWNSPGNNTGVGCHSLLQGILLTQRSTQISHTADRFLYHLSHQGSPQTLINLFWASLGLCCSPGSSLVVESGGHSPFSALRWLLWLWSTGSQQAGSVAVSPVL